MRTFASISVRMKPFIVVFLFFTFILSSTNITGILRELTGETICWTGHRPGKSEAQIPFEKNEKEIEKTEEKKESNLLLALLTRAYSLLTVFELQTFHSAFVTVDTPEPDHLPIYLLKRTLLI